MTYCSSIDVGLFLETNGTVRTCCSGHSLGNIRTESITDIFNSTKYIEIKSEIDAGRPHDSYCKTCVDMESQSGHSTRDYYKNFTTNGTRTIRQIDIRWSNVCNLSCRMCSPEYSSDWAKRLNIPIETTRRDYYADVLNVIAQHRDTIQQVDLLGGEPLMQRQNEQLLELLPDDVNIHVLSNLSVPLENNRIYQLLKTKSRVKWIISLDHIGDKLEYIRHNADWHRIQHNINLLRQDFAGIAIIPTYSIWNALDLRDIYDWADANALHVNWQQIQGNDYSSLKGHGTSSYVLQSHGAEVIAAAISEIDRLGPRCDFLTDVRDRLTKITAVHNSEFLNWTNRTEQFMPPKHTFQELWPELYALINI